MIQRMWPLLAWLVYFLMPFDILPDHFFGPGWTDDLILLGLVYYLFLRQGAPGGPRPGSRKTEGRGSGSGTDTQDGSGADERASKNKPKNPYEILGVQPGADTETIKKAYHRMAAKYHPDKVSHLGEEFQQLAKEKFQDIQWAYEVLTQKGREQAR